MPVAFGSGRVLPDEMRRIGVDGGFDGFDRTMQRGLAPAVNAFVGLDTDEQPVAPVDPVLERLDLRYFHERAEGTGSEAADRDAVRDGVLGRGALAATAEQAALTIPQKPRL